MSKTRDALGKPETLTYHTTPRGHQVKIDVRGKGGPALITFHGGGIIQGSRVDGHIPSNWEAKFPGTWIAADYRLLVPSVGSDILEDIRILLDYVLTLPIDHHKIFLFGGSGGGYPMRLAAMLAAQESQKPEPRYTVIGCISYCGMAGDFLLDHWFKPIIPRDMNISEEGIKQKVDSLKPDLDHMRGGEEQSDCSFDVTRNPNRDVIWQTWHLTGTINDSITGDQGFSEKMKSIPYEKRLESIPEKLVPFLPQAFIEKNGAILPPFLLVHGNKDTIIPYEESVNTERAIKASGGKAELFTVEGADHDMKKPGEASDAITESDEYALKWMNERIREATK
ncbi:Alpha/Beta hydrolase protein [Kockovaella imperatae]|uniref:Alpha/Beta hydrolase protein n=1 Tax=Kockovaella imperatae TaxID=4999 RepID=A0A1Y1UGZ7_9TREE|nr:Alpha/Beta hydrolase protein [Kockovaella imperatae]ORX37318.1 Alpha/Beta hydrolase protein [Kockovaella imperatae]